MNEKDPFLKKLHKELRDFPEEKQKEILEEINNHLEESEQETLGEEQNKHEMKTGSPEEMAVNFKEVYRPRRFLDLLLVILPLYVLFPLLQILLPYFKPVSGELQISNVLLNTRITFLISAFLLVIARRRKALFLSGFWLVRTLMTCLTLIFREERGEILSLSSLPVLIENIFWLLIFLLLLFLLVKAIQKNKNNFLFLVFLLLPLAVLPANLTLYGLISGQSVSLLSSTEGYRWIVLFEKALEISAYCLIFLGTKRGLRWAGLVLLGTGSTYSLLKVYGVHVFTYLPAAFVILFCLLDILKDPLKQIMKRTG